MKDMRSIIGFFVIFLASCTQRESMDELTARVFSLAQRQYTAMDAELSGNTLPRSAAPDGSLLTSNIRWWCSGFYPGSLWYIYEYTHNEHIRRLAEKHTLKLDSIQYVTTDHDVGFQINCSYGNAFRLTGDEAFKPVLYRAAQSLATRFNPVAGVLRSWDFVRERRNWKYPVIIDNMMNLELLMSASELFADDSLRHIACTHANTTLQNHFREDDTSYHLVDYDPCTGQVRSKQTVQGFSDGSTWSRGQAWALYGYTMIFRTTNYQNYLFQAQNIADMLLHRLPPDGIPYWDFDAPDKPQAPRDASAAAIMAAAFVELSRYAPEISAKNAYLGMAEKQIRTLASAEYLAGPGENAGFILKHSVGSFPDNSEVDVPLTYADYYFLEALVRFKKILSTRN
ncbi:MAG: glycoside hydrolase family 88 protein [Dysgonamonadaceae bacterium]|jgi:hypothetical protein|nr:glycoside hydrolase family 88 protein [Dysgonamonadaceae bacterium]